MMSGRQSVQEYGQGEVQILKKEGKTLGPSAIPQTCVHDY